MIEKCVLYAFISFRIRKIAEIENASKFRVGNRMVSPFFCSVDCFPLTTPAPALRGAAHPDPHTPHHRRPCLERLGLLRRHGRRQFAKTSYFLLCLCIFSSSAQHFPSLCTNSTHFFWLNCLPQNRISPTVPMSSATGRPLES